MKRPGLFHVKHLLFLPLALLALVFVACGGLSSPDGWMPPTEAGTLLVVTTDQGELAAVDREDYSVTWRFPNPTAANANPRGFYGEPAVADDAVFAGAYDGDVYKLDLLSGDFLFAIDAGQPVIGGIVEANGVIYFGNDDGEFFALSADNAEAVWVEDFRADDRIWARPLLHENVLYVASMDKRLYAVDAATGARVWEDPFEADGAIAMDPVFAGDAIVIGSFDKHLYVLDPADGSVIHSVEVEDWLWGRPVVDDSLVYVADLSGRVYAVDVTSGEFVWERPYHERKARLRGGGVLVDGTLIYADSDGFVHFIDPQSGQALVPPVEAAPDRNVEFLAHLVEIDGTVLASAEGGDLFRVDPAQRSVTPIDIPEGED